MSGDGRDAFKALEGRTVVYFQVQVLALFLGEVTGNEDKANHEPTWATPISRDQLHTSPPGEVRSQWVAKVSLQESLALSSQESQAQLETRLSGVEPKNQSLWPCPAIFEGERTGQSGSFMCTSHTAGDHKCRSSSLHSSPPTPPKIAPPSTCCPHSQWYPTPTPGKGAEGSSSQSRRGGCCAARHGLPVSTSFLPLATGRSL